jgi:quinol monooxygenase YgiN
LQEGKSDMSYMIVKHTVKDYAVWKKAFDQHATTRKTAGSKGAQVLRNEVNPNEVVVFMEWTSTDAAKKFATSDDLRKVMESAGVISAPEIIFSADSARSAN